MFTGLTPKTFENLQLNAVVFLEGFDWRTYENAGALETAILALLEGRNGVIGATLGGGTFQATPEMRKIEVDGLRYPVVGSTVNDMWTIKLTGTMKEVTPENFKRVLPCSDLTHNNAKTVHTLKMRTNIKPEDYISSFCWVGDTSKGLVLIELKNALNMTGANFTFTDKGEGTLPFEFQAHHKELKDMNFAPCEIVFFDQAA